MEWRDEGIVLAARMFGERDAIISLMTFDHGRHAGLVRGGAGRRAQPLLQPGNRLACQWRGRLQEHLGTFSVEPIRLHAGLLIDDPLRLTAAASACALVELALPEREPHGSVFAGLAHLLGALVTDPVWPIAYVRFELLLLEALGYGLDLDRCAVSGATTDLAFVSPRTGRAVTAAAAAPWSHRLLPLPACLSDTPVAADKAAIVQGLDLAAHFITRHILDPIDRGVPVARERLRALLAGMSPPAVA